MIAKQKKKILNGIKNYQKKLHKVYKVNLTMITLRK